MAMMKKKKQLYYRKTLQDAVVPKRASLHAIAQMIVDASGVISVDTGLGHLSGALDQALAYLSNECNKKWDYGSFSQSLKHHQLCTMFKASLPAPRSFPNYYLPCFLDHPPETVWQVFCKLGHKKARNLGQKQLAIYLRKD